MAAGHVKIRSNRIADCYICHTVADFFDDAGDLVTDDARVVDFDAPRPRMLDGQAGAAGDDAGDRLAGTGRSGVGKVDDPLKPRAITCTRG